MRRLQERLPQPEGHLIGCEKLVLPVLQDAVHDEVMDTAGAARYLHVSRQLLELMRVSGGGPRYAKLGRLVRYRQASLDRWLVERERSHTAEGAVA